MFHNVSTLNDARTAYTNSGWFERLDLDVDNAVARFLWRNASASHIDDDELDALMARCAVEVLGWDQSDL